MVRILKGFKLWLFVLLVLSYRVLAEPYFAKVVPTWIKLSDKKPRGYITLYGASDRVVRYKLWLIPYTYSSTGELILGKTDNQKDITFLKSLYLSPKVVVIPPKGKFKVRIGIKEKYLSKLKKDNEEAKCRLVIQNLKSRLSSGRRNAGKENVGVSISIGFLTTMPIYYIPEKSKYNIDCIYSKGMLTFKNTGTRNVRIGIYLVNNDAEKIVYTKRVFAKKVLVVDLAWLKKKLKLKNKKVIFKVYYYKKLYDLKNKVLLKEVEL